MSEHSIGLIMLPLSSFRVFCTTVVILSTAFILFLSLWPNKQSWLPKSWHNLGINLGLDLQGGSSLLLEIDEDNLRLSRMESLERRVRNILLSERFRYHNLSFNSVEITFDLNQAEEHLLISNILYNKLFDIQIDRTSNGVRLSYTPEYWAVEIDQAIKKTIEVIRHRIDEMGTNEPNIQQQGKSRILVQLPGIDNPKRLKNLLGRTAQLSFHLVDEHDFLEYPRPNYILLPMQNSNTHLSVNRRISISGETLEDSQVTFQNNKPVVTFRFNQSGSKRFSQITSNNINRRLAIVIDEQIISAPIINESITNGVGVITGNFSVNEAQDLALLLRAGSLPANVTIIEERSVGPTLGKDSLRSGKIAITLGLFIIGIVMIASYGIFGIITVLALVINIVVLLAHLAIIQATLTLPGLAGIGLTIGMSVDSNILILERIREELRNGKSKAIAITNGFERALITIVDANITTLFAAICLYVCGSGTIKGFAVTLSFGIITSMFSAIIVTRLLITIWYNQIYAKRSPF